MTMKQVYTKLTRPLLGLAVVVSSPLFSQPVNAPTLLALTSVESGQWQLRGLDRGPVPATSMCVSDPRSLIQLRHPKAQCSRFVIANDPRTATVHYTCPGAGHGQTTIRVETPRLIQIESQGIADQAPFSLRMEARKVGNCGAQTSVLRR
jgi:hypothetical protein